MAFVYRYIAGDNPVYIGRTSDIHARVAAHRCDEWFDSDLGVEYIDNLSDADADMIETYLISSLHPKYNRAKYWAKPKLQIDMSNYHWKPYIKHLTAGLLRPRKEDAWKCQLCGKMALARNTFNITLEIRGPRYISHIGKRICKKCLYESKEYNLTESHFEAFRKAVENDPAVIYI